MLQQVENYKRTHHRRKVWHSIVTCIAAVVVFCTTYALILPAITQEASQPMEGDDAYISEMGMGTTDQD